jgi:hypothetical protein
MNYRMTLAASNNLKRIEGIVADLDRQIAENSKIIADREQANQNLLEARAIVQEYAKAVKADGLR